MEEFWPTGAFHKTTEIAHHQQRLLRADIVKFFLHKTTALQISGCTFRTHSGRKSRSNYHDKSQIAKRILPSLVFQPALLVWTCKQISVMYRAMLVVCTLRRTLAKESTLFCFLLSCRNKILGVSFGIAIEE